MEFNLELAINAAKAGLKIVEVPIKLRPRKGKSKLRTFKDGWRSLRMMLLYTPNHLFLWPGALLLILGFFMHTALLFGLISWDGRPASGVTGVFATGRPTPSFARSLRSPPALLGAEPLSYEYRIGRPTS